MSHSSSSDGKEQDIDDSRNRSSSTTLALLNNVIPIKVNTPDSPEQDIDDSERRTITGRKEILRMSLAKHLVSLIRGTTEGTRVAKQPQQEIKENEESEISTTAAIEESSKALPFIAGNVIESCPKDKVGGSLMRVDSPVPRNDACGIAIEGREAILKDESVGVLSEHNKRDSKWDGSG